MEKVIYAMEFVGDAEPISESPRKSKVSAAAASCNVNSVVTDIGVEGSIQPVDGGSAAFSSEVVMSGDASFTETGTIDFGNDNRIHFSSVGEGYIGPGPDEGLQQGAVSWRIDSGEGHYKNAKGLITSNFTISGSGKVNDHQMGVIFIG